MCLRSIAFPRSVELGPPVQCCSSTGTRASASPSNIKHSRPDRGTDTVARFETTLIDSTTVAEGTMAFRFAKPADFKFEAGHSVNVSLIDPPETDRKGNSRSFSLVSAPYETELMIATRMRDTAFKRSLKAMPGGGGLA